MNAPELIVLNFNKNFTGVSATAAGVIGVQKDQFKMKLAGYPLEGCPSSISKKQAYQLSRTKPAKKPFLIWHVRRNPEMRIALWARDILRLPIKIVFTSAAQRYHSHYPRWLISKMDAVIATTPEAAKYVPNVHAVVPHGVDTNKFHMADNRMNSWKKLGYGGKQGLANIGRIRPEKGTDVFIDTMLEVLPNHLNLTALIVGKTSRKYKKYQQGLEEKIHDAGLSNRIIFTGEIPPEKMPELIRSLSLLVALPRYEGYGMTPLEALASGVPFVSSNTGYFNEFSDNHTLGSIVPIEDSSQAANRISEWLNSPIKHSLASQNAITFVEKNHSINKEAVGISQVYETLWKNN